MAGRTCRAGQAGHPQHPQRAGQPAGGALQGSNGASAPAGVPVIGYVDTNYGSGPRPGHDRVQPVPGLVRRGTGCASTGGHRQRLRPGYYGALSARLRKLGARSCSSTMAHTRTRVRPARRPAGHIRGPMARLPHAQGAAMDNGVADRKVLSCRVFGAAPSDSVKPPGWLRNVTRPLFTSPSAAGANPYDRLPIDTPELRCRDRRGFSSRRGRVARGRLAPVLAAVGVGSRRGGLHGQPARTPAASRRDPGSNRQAGEVLLAAGDPGLLLLRLDLGAGGRHQAAAE